MNDIEEKQKILLSIIEIDEDRNKILYDILLNIIMIHASHDEWSRKKHRRIVYKGEDKLKELGYKRGVLKRRLNK